MGTIKIELREDSTGSIQAENISATDMMKAIVLLGIEHASIVNKVIPDEHMDEYIRGAFEALAKDTIETYKGGK